MSAITREIVLGFVAEANGYLPAIAEGLAAFRAHRDAAALEEPHRCVHTIKGASAMVGLSELSRVAFHLEEVVERLLHEPDTATPELLDGLDRGTEFVRAYLAGVTDGKESQPELTAEALAFARVLRGLPSEEPATVEAPPEAPEPEPEPFRIDDLALPDFDAPLEPEPDADPFGAGDLLAALASGAPASADEPEPTATGDALSVFRSEAEEHVRTLSTLLPDARAGTARADLWQAVRRSAHTLKGSAGLVGLHDVSHLAHRMEDLLDRYYETGRRATPAEVDLLLAATDLIAEAIEQNADGERVGAVCEQLASAAGVEVSEPVRAEPPAREVRAEPAKPAREEAGGFVRVPIERLDAIAKLVGELVIARTALEQKVGHLSRVLGEARPAADRLGRVSNKLEVGYEASALATGRTPRAEFAYAGGHDEFGAGGEAFDELELDRYTEFHLLTRELAETTTDVQTVFGEFGHLIGEVEGELTRQARLASEVEDRLMHLRMVPLSTVAPKLHRTVRTAAGAAQKRAELVIEGERTGLDKTVLEALADPLLHLLRNAVDHGLEAPEVRLALGKPATGTVKVRAAHEGNSVVLVLSDDGAGIDHQRVRAAAVRKGLLAPEAADALTDDEATELLFRPGFSTRDEVTELSGRGVGLDVVKTRIEALKGTVSVASEAGRGTAFTVRLPLTLAVVRALLVRAAGQTFALPLEAVDQILRPDEDQFDRVGRAPVVRAGGALYPLVPLARALGVRAPDSPSEARPLVVLVKAGGRRVALQVDQLLGGREVVVKSLGRQHKNLFGVSGATLLGDGTVVLILNPAELTRGARAPVRANREAAPTGTAPARSREALRVLLVDDSPSVRRVLTMLFTNAGWQPTVAKDGLEALELLQRGGELPDVLLTDVEMPRMDGYELLATVRATPALAHLPVAVLTSRSAEKHRRKALDLGASAYVVKPYQDRDLLDVLRHAARAARA